MTTHHHRSHVSRVAATAFSFTLALALGGCGGGSSTSSGTTSSGTTSSGTSTTQETAAPSPVSEPSSYGESSHGHHHHRHRHHGASASASPDSTDDSSSGASTAAASNAQAASNGGQWPCDNNKFLADQQQFASGSLQGDQEVDVCGTVTSVLASRTTRSGLHGYYKLQVAPGTTIEIVSDLGEMDAPAWPWVKVGDYSYVQGRYYYDSSGSQGIDWTHHGTSRSWPSAGYVVIGGTQYQ